MNLVFLGTGGGRWMTITQRLHTGGFRLHEDVKIHVDPGSGAALRARESRINPLDTDAVLVSHCHPDHYIDAEVFIEAMTDAMSRKAGIVGASRTVLHGNGELGPAISRYHRSMLEREHVLTAGEKMRIGGVLVEALPTRHSDPDGVGFKFYTDRGVIAYTGDTEYFDAMARVYKGSNIMILNVIRPGDERLRWHLCSEDVERILCDVHPETAILTHFGMRMHHIARREAAEIERSTGVRTIPAREGMRFLIG